MFYIEKTKRAHQLADHGTVELHSRAVTFKLGPFAAIWHIPVQVSVNGKKKSVLPIIDVTRLVQLGIWATAVLLIGSLLFDQRRKN